MNTCDKCKFAVGTGHDYDSAFGGGYTPFNIEECHCPNIATEDMDKAIELGEEGKCKRFERRIK